MATITINGVTLDPSAERGALRGAKLLSADAKDSDYLLVQTKGPLMKEERAALEKTGARILEFVPQNTYICRYRGTGLKRIRALPFVAWANTYLRGFKINPAPIPGAARSHPYAMSPMPKTLQTCSSEQARTAHRNAIGKMRRPVSRRE